MGIDLKDLQELQQQLLEKKDDKLYRVVCIERSPVHDLDDNWISLPVWKLPVCDGYWIDASDGSRPFSVSSITSWQDVETIVPELAERYGLTEDEFKKSLTKPFDKIEDADDFIRSLPVKVMEDIRFTPFQDDISYPYPATVFFTREAAVDFRNSQENPEFLYVFDDGSLKDNPQLQLLSDLVKNVDLKVLAKALPKEQKR